MADPRTPSPGVAELRARFIADYCANDEALPESKLRRLDELIAAALKERTTALRAAVAAAVSRLDGPTTASDIMGVVGRLRRVLDETEGT